MLSDIVLYVGGSPQRKVLQFHYDIFLGILPIVIKDTNWELHKVISF
jgi:hypothetical protein